MHTQGPSAPAPSAPSTPSGGQGSPAPTGPGQSSQGPGIAPQPASHAPAEGASPVTPAKPAAPKRDPWMRKVRVGEGDAVTEHEMDLSEHLADYRRKVKVLGAEEEVGIDDMAEMYPLGAGAQRRFAEAAKLRKEAEGISQTWEAQKTAIREGLADPKRATAQLEKAMGGAANVQRWMEEHLTRIYEYEKASPEQRRLMDAEREKGSASDQRERALAQREAAVKASEARQHQAETGRHFEALKVSVPSALEAAGVASTPHTIGLFVQAKLDAKSQGVTLTDAQASALVKREVDALLSGLRKDPAKLRAAIGEEGAEAIRQSELARLDEQPGRRAQRAETPAAQPPRRQERAMTLEQLREQRREESEAALQKRIGNTPRGI